jgi:RNA polymerase sigma-70 factor (ECF subfamily)
MVPETPSLTSETDRQRVAWMVAAQAGDRVAYEMLLRHCIPFIKSVARRQGVLPDGIDDVVQETLLTIHRARQTFDPSRSFDAWLRIIAQRRAIDRIRQQRRHGMLEIHAPLAYQTHPDVSHDPEQAANRVDSNTRLESAISVLPASQREAVQHLAVQEQSLAEAAAATGRTTGALKVNLHRALKTLRAQLRGKE